MRSTDTQDRPAPAPLLDTRSAAAFLGLGVRTLQNWRVRGEGPEYLKISRAVRYDPRTIQAYLEGRRFRSTAEADAKLGS